MKMSVITKCRKKKVTLLDCHHIFVQGIHHTTAILDDCKT